MLNHTATFAKSAAHSTVSAARLDPVILMGRLVPLNCLLNSFPSGLISTAMTQCISVGMKVCSDYVILFAPLNMQSMSLCLTLDYALAGGKRNLWLCTGGDMYWGSAVHHPLHTHTPGLHAVRAFEECYEVHAEVPNCLICFLYLLVTC